MLQRSSRTAVEPSRPTASETTEGDGDQGYVPSGGQARPALRAVEVHSLVNRDV